MEQSIAQVCLSTSFVAWFFVTLLTVPPPEPEKKKQVEILLDDQGRPRFPVLDLEEVSRSDLRVIVSLYMNAAWGLFFLCPLCLMEWQVDRILCSPQRR